MITLAQIFEDALSLLWDGTEPRPAGTRKYCCIAVRAACDKYAQTPDEMRWLAGRASSLLREWGVTTTSMREFDEFPAQEEAQQARALLLTFLAQYCEDEGL